MQHGGDGKQLYTSRFNREDPNTSTLDIQIGGGHYKDMAIQPIEYIMANNLGWCEGNAVKYITRYSLKGGKEDIEKAIHYLEILLEKLK